MSDVFLFLGAFLASAVEMVEALTIVLAVGVTRGWRSPLIGVAAATVALVAIIAALARPCSTCPSTCSGWSSARSSSASGCSGCGRRSCARAATSRRTTRRRPFARSAAEAAAAGREERLWMDWYGFTISFKGVLLEGLEVAFIVDHLRKHAGAARARAAAAGAALVLVAVVGVLVHAPLARVPENTIKFAVGLLLTTFGTFWAAEGAGVNWPGDELALLGLLGFLGALALLLVRLLRRERLALLTGEA